MNESNWHLTSAGGNIYIYIYITCVGNWIRVLHRFGVCAIQLAIEIKAQLEIVQSISKAQSAVICNMGVV